VSLTSIRWQFKILYEVAESTIGNTEALRTTQLTDFSDFFSVPSAMVSVSGQKTLGGYQSITNKSCCSAFENKLSGELLYSR
jgi:hypothetical protein